MSLHRAPFCIHSAPRKAGRAAGTCSRRGGEVRAVHPRRDVAVAVLRHQQRQRTAAPDARPLPPREPPPCAPRSARQRREARPRRDRARRRGARMVSIPEGMLERRPFREVSSDATSSCCRRQSRRAIACSRSSFSMCASSSRAARRPLSMWPALVTKASISCDRSHARAS